MPLKKKQFDSMDIHSFDRDYIQGKAMQFLKKKKFVWIEEIGSGSFGDVIAIKKISDGKMFAAKIVHKLYTSPGEMYLWPCLKHPNVLPYLGRYHFKNIDIFIMPILEESLENALTKPDLRKSPEFFQTTVNWMTDMMTGIEYLHCYGVCHLDVKPDNVLITSDSKAVLCDFSGLAETKEPVNRYVLPKLYCPPECWTDEKDELPSVDGEKLDIWATGLVILHCFTDGWIEPHLFETEKWSKNVYPTIYKCLQQRRFNSLLKKTFTASNIPMEDRKLAFNLLRGVLRYCPENRPSATRILDHPLLSRTFHRQNLLPTDEIWKSYMKDVYATEGEPKVPDMEIALKVPDAEKDIQVPEVDSLEEEERTDKEASGTQFQTENANAQVESNEIYCMSKTPAGDATNLQIEDLCQSRGSTSGDGENAECKISSRKKESCIDSQHQVKDNVQVYSEEEVSERKSKRKKILNTIQSMFSRFQTFFTKKKK